MAVHLTGVHLCSIMGIVMLTTDQLIATRQALGLGKETMARILGVGVSSIHRWERGDTGPTGPVLQCYRALKVALDKGYKPETILAASGGDPGVFLAKVFAMAFTEDKDATRR